MAAYWRPRDREEQVDFDGSPRNPDRRYQGSGRYGRGGGGGNRGGRLSSGSGPGLSHSPPSTPP